MPPRPKPAAEHRRPEIVSVEVWPANWPAWQAFDAARTQWRVGPMGGILGLDYNALHLVMRARSIRIQHLPDVQEIEAAALAEFARIRNEE